MKQGCGLARNVSHSSHSAELHRDAPPGLHSSPQQQVNMSVVLVSASEQPKVVDWASLLHVPLVARQKHPFHRLPVCIVWHAESFQT